MKKSLFALASLILVLSSCGEVSVSPNSQSASEPPASTTSELSSSSAETTSTPLPSSSAVTGTSTVPPVSSSTQSMPPIPSSSSSSGDVYSDSSSSSASGSIIPVTFDDAKWPGLSADLYGESFRAALASCSAINGNTTSYSNCLNVGARAAAYPDANSVTFIPFYHDHTMNDTTTTGQCNREHTWPNSRGGGLIEKDPLIIRPTLNTDNSSRGNDFYGNQASNEWDPGHFSCSYGWQDYAAARGESARVILYAATRYKSKGLSLSNNPNDSTNAKTMGTLKTLLKWNRDYAPSDFEKTVNERYENMGYARNPFVDHPEYADFIWDDNGFRTSPYDGGGYVPPIVSSSTSATSASYSTSSSSSSALPVGEIEITSAEFPTQYPQTETARTMSGVDFKVYYVMNQQGDIQLKKSEGYLYNTSALEEQTTLVITLASGSSVEPLVYLGTTANPSSVAAGTKSGSTLTFDISDSPFFKIKANSSVTKLSSIRIA